MLKHKYKLKFCHKLTWNWGLCDFLMHITKKLDVTAWIGLCKPGILAEENRVDGHLSLEQFCLCLFFFSTCPLFSAHLCYNSWSGSSANQVGKERPHISLNSSVFCSSLHCCDGCSLYWVGMSILLGPVLQYMTLLWHSKGVEHIPWEVACFH